MRLQTTCWTGSSKLTRRTKWVRQLEEENRKLKQIVADLSLDKAMLQAVAAIQLLGLRSAGTWCGS